jgi:hypothetical protein
MFHPLVLARLGGLGARIKRCASEPEPVTN